MKLDFAGLVAYIEETPFFVNRASIEVPILFAEQDESVVVGALEKKQLPVTLLGPTMLLASVPAQSLSLLQDLGAPVQFERPPQLGPA